MHTVYSGDLSKFIETCKNLLKSVASEAIETMETAIEEHVNLAINGLEQYRTVSHLIFRSLFGRY